MDRTPDTGSDPRHVLVVDDDRDACETFQDILELEGYQVTVAHSGHQALELARHCDFGVVLMDIKMPVMDGVETYRKLRELCPDLPVIMISAYAMQDRIDYSWMPGDSFVFGVNRIKIVK